MDCVWNSQSPESRAPPRLSSRAVSRMELPRTEMASPWRGAGGAAGHQGDGVHSRQLGGHVGADKAGQSHLGHMWGHPRSLEVRKVSQEPGEVSAGVGW